MWCSGPLEGIIPITALIVHVQDICTAALETPSPALASPHNQESDHRKEAANTNVGHSVPEGPVRAPVHLCLVVVAILEPVNAVWLFGFLLVEINLDLFLSVLFALDATISYISFHLEVSVVAQCRDAVLFQFTACEILAVILGLKKLVFKIAAVGCLSLASLLRAPRILEFLEGFKEAGVLCRDCAFCNHHRQ